MKRIVVILIVLFSFNFIIYPQSLGVVYEGTSFNLNNLFFQGSSLNNGMIKNIFVGYNHPLSTSIELSLRIGYGGNRIESINGNGTEQSINETNTDGFPIAAEIKYKHKIDKDSVFEPIIGMGVGYYNYSTKFKSDSYDGPEYKTRGFGQYITFGMNINITNSITSCIQFNKIMINNISTKYEQGNSYSEIDYRQGTGMGDISISFGLFVNLND